MHKKDWEMGHLKSLKEEQERNSDSNCSESEDMLTMPREAATNQVKHKLDHNKSRNSASQSFVSRESGSKKSSTKTVSAHSGSSAPSPAPTNPRTRRSAVSATELISRSPPQHRSRSNRAPISRNAVSPATPKSSERPASRSNIRSKTSAQSTPGLREDSSGGELSSPSSRPVRSASRRVVSYEDDPEYLEDFVDEEQEQSQDGFVNSTPSRSARRNETPVNRLKASESEGGVRRSPRSPTKQPHPSPSELARKPGIDSEKRRSVCLPSSLNGKTKNGQIGLIEACPTGVANGATPVSLNTLSTNRSLRSRGSR